MRYNESMSEEYVKTNVEKLFDVDGLYSVHYFRYGKNFSFEGEKHDFWEMVYIDGGKAKITAGEKALYLERGQAVFHKPGEFHNIRPVSDYAGSVILSFSCASSAMKFFENRVVTLKNEDQLSLNRIITEASASFEGKIDEVYMKKLSLRPSAPTGCLQVIAICLESLLISLYRKDKTPSPTPVPAQNNDLVYRIDKILNERLYDELSLADLSAALFFSKTHLKEVYKSRTGKTIMAHYNELKIEEAKKLIGCGNYTFTQIAVKLGYNSAQYFSEKFKKVTGLTPGEYAKSIKINNLLF